MDSEALRVRITVQLLLDVARDLDHPDFRSPSTRDLESLLEQAGATIEPVFTGADDPDLAAWFTVFAPERVAPDLLLRLQRHEAVLAAYIKPPEALP